MYHSCAIRTKGRTKGRQHNDALGGPTSRMPYGQSTGLALQLSTEEGNTLLKSIGLSVLDFISFHPMLKLVKQNDVLCGNT